MSNRSVGEHSWTYETSLHGSTISNNAQAYLLLDGPEILAHVQLDGKTILRAPTGFSAIG